ncbi:GNAT family N-acetyltransferase [Actinokineospora bangkokensis]|uniref:N-acetyltransferase domain-containing protein n=1 Tax=Actinokineospora bangkokensis TaxID=1193682 RepID=A0A1Q9LLL7_9PSEU|nr:GNAT family N-acetyltransferase [Actinokineospora bangkokensis]OLR92911.1 hypothetical protein BJP25_18220 [Actinokineospora bangkokensis]
MIRRATAADEADLHSICLLTGSPTGTDASGMYSDPRLLGAAYAAPYLHAPMALGFVVEDAEGVAGYVVGTPDTAAFEAWCAESWWPALRERHPLTTEDTPDAGLVRLFHNPPTADRSLLADYPAHFHIDLLPRAQGNGWGRRLLTTLLAALAEAGAPGVHLGASRHNTRAHAFYAHLGFTPHSRSGDALYLVRPLETSGTPGNAPTS